MPPFRSVVGVGLLTLLPTLCAGSTADEQTIQRGHIFVQGRHIEVRPPAGTRVSPWGHDDQSLGSVFPDVRVIHAFFISDSLLTKLNARTTSPGIVVDAAVVESDPQTSVAQARAEIARQRWTAGVAKEGDSTARKVSELLRGDPEGRRDVPIELPTGSVVELGTFAIDTCAFGVVQAIATDRRLQSRGVPPTFLRGRAVVVLRDRALVLQMRRDVPASPRTGSVFREDFRSWTRQVVDGNRYPDAADTLELDRSGPLPKFGESVYVEQWPSVVTRVPPLYPIRSQQESASGKVIVQALVGRDGRVHETKVTKTSVERVSPEAIAELEAAAVWAVRQWRFEPASAAFKPVAVWVEIPVTFSLQ